MPQSELDPVALTQRLIRCPSVTPAEGGALTALADVLGDLGFACERLRYSEAGYADIDNLYARIGGGGRQFCFAGHTDVVPVGDAAAWSVDPFAAEIVDGHVIGRGAVDMKGAIACFVAAAADMLARHGNDFGGSIALLITGDEDVECDRADRPDHKGLSMGGNRLVRWIHNEGRSGGTGSGILPVKALPLREKYAWLAAIHAVVGEGVRPIDPYRSDKHSKRGKAVRSRSGWARRLAAMPYAARKTLVRHFTKGDRPRIERMLADVARDLGAPMPMTRRWDQAGTPHDTIFEVGPFRIGGPGRI